MFSMSFKCTIRYGTFCFEYSQEFDNFVIFTFYDKHRALPPRCLGPEFEKTSEGSFQSPEDVDVLSPFLLDPMSLVIFFFLKKWLYRTASLGVDGWFLNVHWQILNAKIRYYKRPSRIMAEEILTAIGK